MDKEEIDRRCRVIDDKTQKIALDYLEKYFHIDYSQQTSGYCHHDLYCIIDGKDVFFEIKRIFKPYSAFKHSIISVSKVEHLKRLRGMRFIMIIWEYDGIAELYDVDKLPIADTRILKMKKYVFSEDSEIKEDACYLLDRNKVTKILGDELFTYEMDI